jgi:hypothetical protein
VKRLDYAEPAVLRGILTALLALAASLGFVIPADLTGAAEGLIPAVAFLLPLVQAWWTRRAVYSPATHNAELGKVAAGLRDGPA